MVDFYITRNSHEDEEINTKCQDTNNCKKVLEYFSDLNLKPLKDKTASEMLNHESKIYYTGMLKFGESPAADTILFSDISVDTPNVLRISSSIPGFKSGYYEMEDSNFDYNYILDLIG